MDVAVSGMQLVALASCNSQSEAAVLDVGKVSGQLGGIRASVAHTQSLAATLLQRPRGGAPTHGIRLAVAGVQLSLAPCWPPTAADSAAKSTEQICLDDPEAICSPLEVQVLLVARTALGGAPVPLNASLTDHESSLQTSRKAVPEPVGSERTPQAPGATAESWALWCAVSPAAVQISPQLLATAAAVGGQVPIPQASTITTATPGRRQQHGPADSVLGDVMMSTSAVLITFSPLGAATVSTEDAGHIRPGTLHVAAEAARLTVAAAQPSPSTSPEPLGAVEPSLHLVIHSISCSMGADDLAVSAALVEAGFGPHTAAMSAQLPVQLTGLNVTLKPSSQHSSANLNPAATVEHPLPPQKLLRVAVGTASLALSFEDWARATWLTSQLSSGPLLPVDSADDPVPTDAPGPGLDVEATLDTLLLSIATEARSKQGLPQAGNATAAAMGLAAAGFSFLQTTAAVSAYCWMPHCWFRKRMSIT